MTKVVEADKGFKVWWHLTRPHTLTASFVPVLLGTSMALSINHETVHFGLFFAMLIASMLIQAATNMFNEYYDYKLGLDNENSVGIGGTIVRHGVAPKTIMAIALSFYGIAMLLGVYICAMTSWWLVAVGLVCMLIGYLYTGGPYPIAYSPFGELVSGAVMGMGIVLIAFFIQTGDVTADAVIISVPSMILVGAIMLSNNIRDIVGDTEGGRKTMAILVGRHNAVTVLAGFFIVSYIWIAGLVILGHLTPWALLVLLSVKKPIEAIKLFRAKEKPLEVMPAMKYTAQTNTIFGFLLAVGLLVSYFI
ncbi:1,4-dihydroxy-2-naphthoate polyprenyltransferase [Solibacillus sp. FSL K6-1781]|uniref:1,4-dihydroxy-2-naphthoate octaprenyltransferase n=1 Tax=Solibacillus isronensis B3W22 TaxID=1224748 RepID=K1KVC9_9BACL|nr:1,4-dihydroxy-2-naphthoate polyprenyltransferase [Solibacillus isronensis]AMO86444.1 1,4-dihydroxy-2-naphthoate octaprenyltransferase [Solibacillus silvestris]EKB43817.1 1,4-dihydroxy-2-naphthoate octaprenyltransferase [Solibacillus isronensis B3W22]